MHKRQLSQQVEEQPLKKPSIDKDEEVSEEDDSLSSAPMPPIAILEPTTISSTSISSRKHAHILSEQRRRENINGGFKQLKNAVPFCKGTQDSKAMILKKAVEYIGHLQQELNQARYASPQPFSPPAPAPAAPPLASAPIYRTSTPPLQQFYTGNQMPPPPPLTHTAGGARYSPVPMSYYYPDSIARPATTPPIMPGPQSYRRNYSLPVPPRGSYTPPPLPRL
jgi:hypothetical protein